MEICCLEVGVYNVFSSVPGCLLLTLYFFSDNEVFPHNIVRLEPSLSCQLMRDFSGEKEGFLRVGHEGWLLPSHYATQAHGYYNMPLRSDDVWIATFPRSGLLTLPFQLRRSLYFQLICLLLNHNALVPCHLVD